MVLVSSFLLVAAPAFGQLLPSPAPPDPDQPRPLIYRAAGEQPRPVASVDEAVERLRAEMRATAKESLTVAEREAQMRRLLEEHRQQVQAWQAEHGAAGSVDLAIERLERAFFEEALKLAPDEESRRSALEHTPRRLHLERNQPILIAPEIHRSSIVLTEDAAADQLPVPWWKTTRFDTEALALDEVPESPEKQLEPAQENLEAGESAATDGPVEVSVLADENVTVEMHDDSTILRTVSDERGDLVLFEGLNIWFGGAVQYDHVELDDLYVTGGGSDSNSFTRRAEVTVRSTLFDLGELKAQYDVDGQFWRDLYYRYADEEKEFTITAGNQTEPFSQENILGNKFNAPMEVAAPTSAFAPGKAMGIRLNKWFQNSRPPSILSLSDDPEEAVTASIGIFGEDIENTNDLDWAVTGRSTAGRKHGDWGLHVGVSGSYREGKFDRINPRPELQGTDRITLASFDAERAAVAGLELHGMTGSWHASSEFFYADFADGDVDATGYGGFVEVGYYLTGQSRAYRPRWGLWAPLKVGARNIFEVFGRVSYTYGDSDAGPSNDLRIATVGGSWYRHKLRVSANLLYAETDRPVRGQDDGVGAGLRFQYLF